MAPFDERFDAARERGRALVVGAETSAHHDEPFVLATSAAGGALDAAIRGVSAFAFVMAAIVTGLVVVGAAPKLIEIFAAFWITAALGGRLYARRRRTELGRTLIDFDAGVVEHAPLTGTPRRFSLGDAELTVTRSSDAEAPYWLTLTTAA